MLWRMVHAEALRLIVAARKKRTNALIGYPVPLGLSIADSLYNLLCPTTEYAGQHDPIRAAANGHR